MTTKNGCWNCAHGGNLKILRTLMRSLELEPGIVFPIEINFEIRKRLDIENNRCEIDASYQAETGFMCEKWKYNDCGFRER